MNNITVAESLDQKTLDLTGAVQVYSSTNPNIVGFQIMADVDFQVSSPKADAIDMTNVITAGTLYELPVRNAFSIKSSGAGTLTITEFYS